MIRFLDSKLHRNNTPKNLRSPSRVKNLDQFLDTMSIGLDSLYTSPSKPSVFSRGGFEWPSSRDTEFTAEIAFVQYKLGCWQSPPAIESALTPSTEKTFSPPSPSEIHRDEDELKDTVESNEISSPDGVEAMNHSNVSKPVSQCSQTVNNSPPTVDNVKESDLGMHSTASSDISRHVEIGAFQKRVTSERACDKNTSRSDNEFSTNYDDTKETNGIRRESNEECEHSGISAKKGAQQDAMEPLLGKDTANNDIEANRKRNCDQNHQSASSSISSLSTNHCRRNDCSATTASAWSAPPCFMRDHSGPNKDRLFVIQHICELPVSTRMKPLAMDFLGRNSKYSQDHSIPKILSFEETKVADSISKCSSESFAQRQTPHDATHFTTPISSDELLSSPTKHFSKDNMKGIESSSGCMETKTFSIKNQILNLETPIANNLSKSVSCNHSTQDASIPDPMVEVESSITEDSTRANALPHGCSDFGSILSKFEAQSLECGVEPPVCRRLFQHPFEVMFDRDRREETSNCSDGSLCRSEQAQDKIDEPDFPLGDCNSRIEKTTLGSSSRHEEIKSQNQIQLDCPRGSDGIGGIVGDSGELPSYQPHTEKFEQTDGGVLHSGQTSMGLSSVAKQQTSHQIDQKSDTKLAEDEPAVAAAIKIQDRKHVKKFLIDQIKPMMVPYDPDQQATMQIVASKDKKPQDNAEQTTLEQSHFNVEIQSDSSDDGPIDLDEFLVEFFHPKMNVTEIKSTNETIPDKTIILQSTTKPSDSKHENHLHHGQVDLNQSDDSAKDTVNRRKTNEDQKENNQIPGIGTLCLSLESNTPTSPATTTSKDVNKSTENKQTKKRAKKKGSKNNPKKRKSRAKASDNLGDIQLDNATSKQRSKKGSKSHQSVKKCKKKAKKSNMKKNSKESMTIENHAVTKDMKQRAICIGLSGPKVSPTSEKVEGKKPMTENPRTRKHKVSKCKSGAENLSKTSNKNKSTSKRQLQRNEYETGKISDNGNSKSGENNTNKRKSSTGKTNESGTNTSNTGQRSRRNVKKKGRIDVTKSPKKLVTSEREPLAIETNREISSLNAKSTGVNVEALRSLPNFNPIATYDQKLIEVKKWEQLEKEVNRETQSLLPPTTDVEIEANIRPTTPEPVSKNIATNRPKTNVTCEADVTGKVQDISKRVDHNYGPGKSNKKVVSSSASKRVKDSGNRHSKRSLVLREDELVRHEKSMERQKSAATNTIPGYDDWKRKEDSKRLYFERLDEKVTTQQLKGKKSGSSCKGSSHFLSHSLETSHQSILEKKTKMDEIGETLQNKKSWKSVFCIFGRASKEKAGKKRKQRKIKAKKEEIVALTSLDNFMQISTNKNLLTPDGFADLSLFPLNQLENLTKTIGHHGLQKKINEHIEWERQRQRLAEIDQEKNEWCDQIRTSILKECELERQRRLNSPTKASNVSKRISPQSTSRQSGLNLNGIVDPHKLSQEGYVHYSTPIKYLNDESKGTMAKSRKSGSPEMCSVNSFLHTNFSFASVHNTSPSSSPDGLSPLPPCAVCKVANRTHISIPCMHYSFCSECAEDIIRMKTPTCPICQKEGIRLRKVYN